MVNKIIYNTLLTGESIFLPGIGTLTVESHSAQQSSRREIAPSYRAVVFTEGEHGLSLTDEIARTAEVDAERASALYGEWRAQNFHDGVLTVAGVGTLAGERFTADREFTALLNPQGTKPVKMKPLVNWPFYTVAALCCLLAVGIFAYIIVDNSKSRHAAQPAAAAVAAVEATDEPQSVSPAPAPAAEEVEPAATEIAAEEGVQNMVAGQSYLAMGVFSLRENAFKALNEARAKLPDTDCRVFRYGDKYLVSLFNSSSIKDCDIYKDLISDKYKELWIYTNN